MTTTLSPRLDGDLSSLSYRMAPADVATLQLDMMGGTPSEEECGQAANSSTPADRLYRCGCGTNTIHINARGELGTCTLQYERTGVTFERTAVAQGGDRQGAIAGKSAGLRCSGGLTRAGRARSTSFCGQKALGCAPGNAATARSADRLRIADIALARCARTRHCGRPLTAPTRRRKG